MPKVTKINSRKGVVEFTREELIDLDLTRWIKSDSKGIIKRDFISIHPIEKAAARFYVDKYPSEQVKLAEKCFLNIDGSLSVVLRVSAEVSEDYYKHHPTKLTFLGDVRAKEEVIPKITYTEYAEENIEKTAHGLQLPIDFLEENIDGLTDVEKYQIYTELGKKTANIFLQDIGRVLSDAENDFKEDNIPDILMEESGYHKDIDFVDEY